MRFNSTEQINDFTRSGPAGESDLSYNSSSLWQDEYGDSIARAAKVHQNFAQFYQQLTEAHKLMVNQGFSAARPVYEATIKFAHGLDQPAIEQELRNVQRKQIAISDPDIQQVLLNEGQELKILQKAESIGVANLGLAELEAGKSAQGTVDLMQAASLNPLILRDPDFQRHFTKTEKEIETCQNQAGRAGATFNVSGKDKEVQTEPSDQDSHKLLPALEQRITNKSKEEEEKRAKKEWEDTVSNLGGTAAGIAVTAGLAFLTKGNCSVALNALTQLAELEGTLGKAAGMARAALASKPAIMAINSLASKPGMLASGIATSILARYTIEKRAFHNQDVNVLSPDNVIGAVTNYLGMGAMVSEGQKMLKVKVVPQADVKFLGLK